MTCKYTSQDQMVRGAAPVLHRGLTTATPVKPPRPRKPWPVALLITLSLIACAPPPPEVNLNMPVFPGPFLDPQYCESNGGGWLLQRLEGYTLWQMEQVGIDELGDVQIRYEVRDGDLSCPLSYVDAIRPEFLENGLSDNLMSAWVLYHDGGGFTGAVLRELETFLHDCYAERINDDDCHMDGTSGMGVWGGGANKVDGTYKGPFFIIINGKAFDGVTSEMFP